MGAQVDWQLLRERAQAVRLRGYAPYSRFTVGAALLTEEGEIFCGCNVENVSLGLTICAERVAVASAVAAGYQVFLALAISSAAPGPIAPCGACRQFLAEFGVELPIRSVGQDGPPASWKLSDLLPAAFDRISF